MLWYKSWLETQWRFLIGLALLLILAVGIVVEYPATVQLLPQTRSIEATGKMGRMIADAIELQRDYRGFVWWQWHRQNLAQLWILFAALLGSGGLLSRAAGGGTLFTLSLPASRNHLFSVRAAVAMAELVVLAIGPSLLIVLLSPMIEQRYGVTDAVVYGVCLFIGGTPFFSLAMLLSTVFDDLWRPMLLVCAVAVALAVSELVLRDLAPYGIFRVASGASYFRAGQLPWLGLLISAAASLTMLFAAARNFARRDF